ncbi:hypothetical protein CsSME_00040517 [Camellia sinensis var. sinensis]
MAQEEATTTRVDPLGDDDAIDLAEQYRTERREGEGASQAVRARPRTIISAARPISQVEPDHWHTKPDRSVLTVEELERLRKKYQILAKVGLRLSTSKERASDVRPDEFSLYEEALRGGLRLPLPQVVVDVLNKLEVAPGQLMLNAWKILMACASSWHQATGGTTMIVDEFFSGYKASGQQETWVTLQAVAGRGLVAGLPSSGWRPRWFFVIANDGARVRTMWKVPTKSIEPRLDKAAKDRVKRVREWREEKGVRWDELVLPSTLFAVNLGPQPLGEDPAREELERQRKAKEEEKRLFTRANKYKETQLGPTPKPIARERIRLRPKPLGGKDLGGFELRLPRVNPLKERNKKEIETLKKKKRVRESEGEPALKRMKEVTTEETPEVGLGEAAKGVESGATGPEEQMESGAIGAEQRAEPQPKEGLAPQGEKERAGLKTAFYHVPAVSRRVKGEVREARMAADRLLGVVKVAVVRSVVGFTEVELLRGLCSAQMEATALAGALLNKAAAAKGKVGKEREKLGQVKAQLENFKKESVGWRKPAQSVYARGLEEAQKAKKIGVLAMVQGNVTDGAYAELLAAKLELEDERRKVVSLEFQLAGEQKKLEEAQKACTVANERWDEAMTCNEDLRAQSIKEKEEADLKIAGLEKDLADERARAAVEKARLEKELEEEKTKAASERAAYPNLYVAAVEQFKGSTDFQMDVDAAIANNLAREGSGGAGPSGATAGSSSEEEVIQSFQRSDFYKHEIIEFWDSDWKMFKRKAEELFPDLDLSSVKIDEDDVAQTPLDEGVEEEDLVSSEEE